MTQSNSDTPAANCGACSATCNTLEFLVVQIKGGHGDESSIGKVQDSLVMNCIMNKHVDMPRFASDPTSCPTFVNTGVQTESTAVDLGRHVVSDNSPTLHDDSISTCSSLGKQSRDVEITFCSELESHGGRPVIPVTVEKSLISELRTPGKKRWLILLIGLAILFLFAALAFLVMTLVASKTS